MQLLYPIKLLCALRMIFAMKSVINHVQRRCLYLGILSPLPKLGNYFFVFNIIQLRHARACPGHPGAVDACCDGSQERFFRHPATQYSAAIFLVTPAKAGVSGHKSMSQWPEIPAFAGMTMLISRSVFRHRVG